MGFISWETARVRARVSFLLAALLGPPAATKNAGLKGDEIVVLLLFGILIGLILGAAGAAAVLRPNRERLRDELKSISADVLAQTGDSLAQRLAEARRAEEERAAGEMALARRSSSGWWARCTRS